MVLGNRGSRWRCLLVWSSGTALALALSALLRPETHDLLALRPGTLSQVRQALDAWPLDRALVVLAGWVLQGAVLWAWLAGSATVAEAWRGVVPRRRRVWHLPLALRRLVLAGCGVALATGVATPALASPDVHRPDLHRPDPHLAVALAGLPVPDRVALPDGPLDRTSRPLQPVRHSRAGGAATPAARVARRVKESGGQEDGPPDRDPGRPSGVHPGGRPAADRAARHTEPAARTDTARGPVLGADGPSPYVVTVRPGDSLWSIAARDLAGGADQSPVSVRRIIARWHQIYAANLAVIGPDPDVIEPGQRLVLPREDQP